MKHAEPLGPDTPTFLRIILISDVASKYARIAPPPKNPYTAAPLLPEEYIALRGAFSGINYELLGETIATISAVAKGKPVAEPAFVLESGALKGVFWGHPRKLPPEAATQRPSGTILSFNFPIGEDRWLLKTFIVD